MLALSRLHNKFDVTHHVQKSADVDTADNASSMAAELWEFNQTVLVWNSHYIGATFMPDFVWKQDNRKSNTFLNYRGVARQCSVSFDVAMFCIDDDTKVILRYTDEFEISTMLWWTQRYPKKDGVYEMSINQNS